MKKKRYFSIISDLVATDLPAEFDLYINSSLLPQKEKFVRIFKKGKQLKKEYLLEFVSKYHQLYVSESQRKYYLRSISKREDLTDLKKAEVAKSIAVDHLRTIFNRQTSSGEQNIFENELVQCKETVEEMIEFVKDKKFKELQKVLGQLSIHDSYTYDHSINVAFYSISFYSFLHPDCPKSELVSIGMGGLLHDLGKKKISTSILNFSGVLSDEQFGEIKKHPDYGVEVMECSCCAELDRDLYNDISAVVLEHHENINGTGYPAGKKGDEINYYARVVAIIDFYDAVTSYRSYHDPLSPSDAIKLMSKSVNKKIDNELFEKFKDCVGEVLVHGNRNIQLPSDFDPCRPHDVLPFEKVEPEKIEEDIFDKKKKGVA